MRIQSSAKEPKICPLCDNIITTTSKRFVDDGIHKCMVCDNKDKKPVFVLSYFKLVLAMIRKGANMIIITIKNKIKRRGERA